MNCRSQWPTAARLLISWVRIRPGPWIPVCCVLSGRGLCDGLITRPEESYRLCCVVVCDVEITKILVNEEETKAHWEAIAPRKKSYEFFCTGLVFVTSFSYKKYFSGLDYYIL